MELCVFGVIMICIGCGFCFSGPKVHSVTLDDNDSSDEQEYVLIGSHCCDHKEHYAVVISILLVIAGTICLFLGSGQFDVVHTDGTGLLNSKLDIILPAIHVANESLYSLLDKAQEYLGNKYSVNTGTINDI